MVGAGLGWEYFPRMTVFYWICEVFQGLQGSIPGSAVPENILSSVGSAHGPHVPIG
jgi:hypothetical protein